MHAKITHKSLLKNERSQSVTKCNQLEMHEKLIKEDNETVTNCHTFSRDSELSTNRGTICTPVETIAVHGKMFT